jgi:16S rRNA G966 N2-methylase RsmD
MVLSHAVKYGVQAAGGRPASLRPGQWLDLYSGTGSVGIEAISRGCSEVCLVLLCIFFFY